ncbi:hypothetical protein EIP91_004853 [Steccherinum ochraceum]|uniref:Large ribosomal subunit protein mL40 n=1 Tax=Steccherinum ochraceum TaxID=92696 RepID=A0A4R0S1Q9_9APHY|nr:hypothetical protein EIP91_004853 [Steccherinum ochraceum]
MASALLSLRHINPPLRVAQTSVRYAAKEINSSDPRIEIIRRVLYPSNLRNRASPTGGWRPDVGRRLQRAIPSVQAHETIERAWLLHQRHIRRSRQSELDKKFQSMRNAMEKLRELDPVLYRAANELEDPRARSEEETELLKTLKGPEKKAMEARIRGLFPRELRVPTETPSRDGWNYNWTPPSRTVQ